MTLELSVVLVASTVCQQPELSEPTEFLKPSSVSPLQASDGPFCGAQPASALLPLLAHHLHGDLINVNEISTTYLPYIIQLHNN